MILEVAKKNEEIGEKERRENGEKFKNTSKPILGVQINQEDQQY